MLHPIILFFYDIIYTKQTTPAHGVARVSSQKGVDMPSSTSALMIIFIFTFVPLVLAEVARNKSLPTLENFFLQDREMSLPLVMFTVYATWVSSFAFLGSASSFYFNGPVYLTAFAWNALFGILFMVLGKRIWFYGKRHGYITPTDFFSDIYGSPALNLLITLVMLVFTIPYLQIQLSGGAYLIEIATDGLIPWKVSGLLFYLIIIIYLWAGGLRAVALADVFYGVLIFISMLTIGFFSIYMAGGSELVFQTILERGSHHLTLTDDQGNSQILSWLTLFFIIPVGAIMGPQMWVRAYAVAQPSTFRIMPFLLTFAAIMYLGSILSGSAGILLAPEIQKAETVIPALLVKYASGPLAAFLFCGVAAASLSTANSQIHAVSAIYTMDIHRRYIDPRASEKRLVFMAKWAVLFLSAFAFLLLINSPVVIVDTGTIAMSGTAQVIIPVIGAFFWEKSNPRAAITGILLGLTVLGALRFGLGLPASYCGLIALLVNGGAFLLLSSRLQIDPHAFEKIQQYKRLYKLAEGDKSPTV